MTTQISESGAGNDPALKMSGNATYDVPCTMPLLRSISLFIMVIMSHQEKISLCVANYFLKTDKEVVNSFHTKNRKSNWCFR